MREWLGQLPARVVLGTDNAAEGASRVTGALLVTILTMFTITRGAQSVHGALGPRPPPAAPAGAGADRPGRLPGRRRLHAADPGPGRRVGGRGRLRPPSRSTSRPRRCSACGSACGASSRCWASSIGYLPVIGLAAAEDRDARASSPSSILVVWLGWPPSPGGGGSTRHSVDVSRVAADPVGHDRPPRRAGSPGRSSGCSWPPPSAGHWPRPGG